MSLTKSGYINLYSLIEQGSVRTLPDEVNSVVRYFISEFESSLLGILFYGSCLRNQDCSMIMDFHVLVDNYWCKGQKCWEACLNKIIPPNVYNLKTVQGEKIIHSKYAVYPLKTFCRATSKKWLLPYIWARFAQPTVIAYARDTKSKVQICQGLVQALLTFVEQTIPLMSNTFSIEELWQTGLKTSYTTELRAERTQTIASIFKANKIYFKRVTPLAINLSKYKVKQLDNSLNFKIYLCNKKKSRVATLWKIRKIIGKWLTIIRLAKCSLTFEQPVDYLITKLEKHSKSRIFVNPCIYKHPILGTILMAIKLYRQGVIK